jgi:hypothetical protein
VGESYRFENRWLLDASLRAAYDVLVDVERYPLWWRHIRAVASLGEDHALVVCRSALPFNLNLELRPVTRDPEAGVLEVSINGDLEGWSRYTLTPTDDGVDIRYEQEVVTVGALLGATRYARSAARANHHWMMRSARRGLVRELSAPAARRTSASPA